MLNFQSGFAKKSTDSAYPSLWRGLKHAWVPQLARTGNKLHDYNDYDSEAILYNNPKQHVKGLLYSGNNYGVTGIKVTDLLSETSQTGITIVFTEAHTVTTPITILSCMNSSITNGIYITINQASGFSIPQRIDVRISGSGTRALRIATFGETLSDNKLRTHILTIGPGFLTTNTKYYINGMSQGLTGFNNSFGLLSEHNLLLNLANYNLVTTHSNYFKGVIGPIYIYNRVLNIGERKIFTKNIMSPFIPKVKMFGPVAPAPPRPTTLPYYDTNIINISRSRIHVLGSRTRSVVLPRRF